LSSSSWCHKGRSSSLSIGVPVLVEAAQVTVRSLPEWRRKYVHLTMRRGRKIAKVAMARKLAVRLYWMMRKGWDYEQLRKFGSHAGQPGNRYGVKSNIE
jgi:transposase